MFEEAITLLGLLGFELIEQEYDAELGEGHITLNTQKWRWNLAITKVLDLNPKQIASILASANLRQTFPAEIIAAMAIYGFSVTQASRRNK